MSKQRGRLIALEGIDGAGTTTQAQMLARWLRAQSVPVHLTREPSKGPVGKLLRRVLSGASQLDSAAVALLFASDRLDHISREIVPKLANGTTVVTDRYVYSSLAYQSITEQIDWVGEINARAPEADLTIYLRIEPRVAAVRRANRDDKVELFDALPTQRKISRQYDRLLGAKMSDGLWRQDKTADVWWCRQDIGPSTPEQIAVRRSPKSAIIDGSQEKHDIHQQIRSLIQTVGIDRKRGN